MSDPSVIAAARDRALAAITFSRSCTRDLLHGISEEQSVHRRADGEPHAMWIVGHLAVSDEWIEGMIAPFESRLPPIYKALFGHRTNASSDATVYPPFEEAVRHCEAARRSLIQTVRRASETELLRPLGDAGVGLATDPLDAVNKIAWHEGWHGGQLSRIRRSLGLPGVFPE